MKAHYLKVALPGHLNREALLGCLLHRETVMTVREALKGHLAVTGKKVAEVDSQLKMPLLDRLVQKPRRHIAYNEPSTQM
jgi:hypothetical protein